MVTMTTSARKEVEMDKDDVKHIGSYLEIYRYVAGESRTLDEIRKHLASIKVPASTINSQMKAISGKTEGLLKKNGDMITVDSVKEIGRAHV